MLVRRQPKRNNGFTLIEVMIVVMITGILISIAVPNFIRSRETSRRKACVSNLKKIDGAKEQFAMDTGKATGDAVAMGDLAPAYLRDTPVCPSDGVYTVGSIGETPVCSSAGHAL